jgi:uncharacterized protein (DUF849 family)
MADHWPEGLVIQNPSISLRVKSAMIIKKPATAAEIPGGIASPSRAQIFRERAKSLREMAALMARPDIRKDLANIALQYELVAESIEPVEKKRRGRKPKW